MTVVASVAAGDMRRILAGGGNAIVARATSANYLRVVDIRRWGPYRRTMAVFANIGGLNVRLVLAGCIGAVVTADAVTENVYVVEIRGQPGSCNVAVVAGVAAGNVGLVFAGRSNAIVAANTIAKYVIVIEHSR